MRTHAHTRTHTHTRAHTRPHTHTVICFLLSRSQSLTIPDNNNNSCGNDDPTRHVATAKGLRVLLLANTQTSPAYLVVKTPSPLANAQAIGSQTKSRSRHELTPLRQASPDTHAVPWKIFISRHTYLCPSRSSGTFTALPFCLFSHLTPHAARRYAGATPFVLRSLQSKSPQHNSRASVTTRL